MIRPPTSQEQSLLNQAIGLHQAGRVAQARLAYRDVLALRPDDPDLLRLAGAAELQLGDHDAALDLLTRSLAIAPNQPGVLYNRGLALQALGRMDDAVADYEDALRLRPAYADAYVNRGNALLELQRYDEALASYDRALALAPEAVQTYVNRAIALVALGKLETAAACYHKALALNPAFGQAHAGLAVIYERQRDHKRAVVQWSRMAEQFSSGAEGDRASRLLALNNMARLLADELNDPDGAATVAKLAADLS